jgi:hypothetical protein
MIVAGQLVCVLLDQRALLAQIHETLTTKVGAGGEPIRRS